MNVRFLASDQEEVRQRLAGLRMCAENRLLADERCVDVILSDQEDVLVALNVPPAEAWIVKLWAFDRGGQALWAGRSQANVHPGESTRKRVLLSQCSAKTAVECGEETASSPCHAPRPRAFHTSTPLPGGLVLLAGGFTAVAHDLDCGDHCRVLVADDTAEVYDPVEGRVTHVIQLARPRAMHTATLTSDGRYVVLAGGVSSARFHTDGEAPLVVPHSFTMHQGGEATAELVHTFLHVVFGEVELDAPRFMHSAVGDRDQGVILIGGITVDQGSLRLIADDHESPPSMERVSMHGSERAGTFMLAPRRGHASLRLGDRLIVVGGNAVMTGEEGVFAEIHHLRAGESRPLGAVEDAGARQRGYAPKWLSLTSLGRGRLLALGGYYESRFIGPDFREAPALSPLSAGLLLDTTKPGVPGELIRMLMPRAAHTSTLLEDGRVLVSGGLTKTEGLRVTGSVEIVRPFELASEAVLDRLGSPVYLAGPRFGHAATRLPDGAVLRSGGLTTVDSERMDDDSPCAVIACELFVYNPASCDLSPPVEPTLLQ